MLNSSSYECSKYGEFSFLAFLYKEQLPKKFNENVRVSVDLYYWLYHVSSAGITEGFSMCAGDFVEVYNDASQEGIN